MHLDASVKIFSIFTEILIHKQEFLFLFEENRFEDKQVSPLELPRGGAWSVRPGVSKIEMP